MSEYIITQTNQETRTFIVIAKTAVEAAGKLRNLDDCHSFTDYVEGDASYDISPAPKESE